MEKEYNSKALYVGSLICMGLLLIFIFAGVRLFADARTWGFGTYKLKVSFPHVKGLPRDADVEISGVNVGYVSSEPRIIDEGRAVEVDVRIQNETRLREDARFLITYSEMFGGPYIKVINAKPKSRSSALLQDGQKVTGEIDEASMPKTVSLEALLPLIKKVAEAPKDEKATTGEPEKATPLATIDLTKPEGIALVNGQWRYSDVKIIEVDGKGPDGQPNRTNDYTPKAGATFFDDSAWEVLDPTTLGKTRAGGKICFNWYRINITIPAKIGGVDTTGATVFFDTIVDDYGEIWVDGKLPRALGQSGGSIVKGFNAPNRLEIGKDVKPGDKIQIAIFGINGPISAAPGNYIFLRYAKLDFYPPVTGKMNFKSTVTVPKKAVEGQSFEVEISLEHVPANPAPNTIVSESSTIDGRKVSDVVLTEMSQNPNLQIVRLAPSSQELLENSPPRWKWKVTPKKSGDIELSFELKTKSGPDLETITEIKKWTTKVSVEKP